MRRGVLGVRVCSLARQDVSASCIRFLSQRCGYPEAFGRCGEGTGKDRSNCRQTTEAVATAGDQISDAISTILSEMVDRFRKGRQAAGDQAGRLGNQALDLGAKYGSNALQRVASEAEHRPLITVGVALGIGILIGAAILGSASSRR